MLTSVRKTHVLVENASTTRAHTRVTAGLATRAHSPEQSAETLTSVCRTAGSVTMGAASTQTAASTACATRASTSLGMERTVKIWMSAASETCASTGCASMKMGASSVFANLGSSWHQTGATAKTSTSVKPLESA